MALLALLDAGANPNDDFFGGSPLRELAMSSNGGGDRERCAQLLFDRGAEIDSTDRLGRSALHVAAEFGSPTVLKWLLKQGVNLNRTDFEGNTPLHLVARDAFSMSGYRSEKDVEEVITSLIEAGADTLIENKDGKTAVEICRLGQYKRDAFDAAISSSANREKSN